MGISMQEYFDKTIEHLASMPHRAMRNNGYGSQGCSYLTEEGLKCAVGFHIPDGHPAQSSDAGVGYLAKACPDLAGIAWPSSDRGVNLAEALQGLHDRGCNWGDNDFCGWDAAEWIADDFGLDNTILTKLKG